MMSQSNSSFSKKLPSLQLFVDASSLTEFKICPRRYFYSMVMGRQPQAESIHLTFGTLLHSAVEKYHFLKFKGCNHAEALRSTVKWLMIMTWDKEHNRPWTSNDNYKNRYTLVRTVVWYLDQYEHDELVTAIIGGRPAVELPFVMDSGYTAFTGEDFHLVGKLDRIVIFQHDYYVSDIKTTKSTIGDYYFSRYTPDNQVTVYSIAGSNILQNKIEGLIIDAAQIAVSFSAFKRGLVERSEAYILEWQEELGDWLMQLNSCAENNRWPRNDAACNLYGGCPFRPVCSQKNPMSAQKVLDGTYRDRMWDPLKNRTLVNA